MWFLLWLQLELQGREVPWVKGHEEPAALPSVLKSCAAEWHAEVEVRQGALGEEVEPYALSPSLLFLLQLSCA